MAKGLLIVLSNAVEGCDEKFNDWYTNKHLRDVLAVEGFVAAQRYRLAHVQLRPDQETPHRYLAIYEIEADDLEEPLRGLLSGLAERSILLDDTLALDTLTTFAFVPITERITAVS